MLWSGRPWSARPKSKPCATFLGRARSAPTMANTEGLSITSHLCLSPLPRRGRPWSARTKSKPCAAVPGQSTLCPYGLLILIDGKTLAQGFDVFRYVFNNRLILALI